MNVMQHPESSLQTKVCKWLRTAYPGILFISDFAAGLYFKEQWIRVLRASQSCDDKYLDLTIMRPAHGYHGLVIEIKVDPPFLKDGRTLNSEHVQLQYESILKLRSEGYFADFGIEYDDCCSMVRDYFSGDIKVKDILPFRGKMSRDVADLAADQFFGDRGL